MSRSDRDFRVCLSRSFVSTRCCVLTWVMKIMTPAILNVHAGRTFPTPGLTDSVVVTVDATAALRNILLTQENDSIFGKVYAVYKYPFYVVESVCI